MKRDQQGLHVTKPCHNEPCLSLKHSWVAAQSPAQHPVPKHRPCKSFRPSWAAWRGASCRAGTAGSAGAAQHPVSMYRRCQSSGLLGRLGKVLPVELEQRALLELLSILSQTHRHCQSSGLSGRLGKVLPVELGQRALLELHSILSQCMGAARASGILGRLGKVLPVELGKRGVLEQEQALRAVGQAAATLEAQALQLRLQPLQAQRLQLCCAAVLGQIHRLMWCSLCKWKDRGQHTPVVYRNRVSWRNSCRPF